MAKTQQRHEITGTGESVGTVDNKWSLAAKRFAELVRQGRPVLVGSEIVAKMRDEGFGIYEVARAILDISNDSPFNFAVSIVSGHYDGPGDEPPSLYVSDTQLDPEQQLNALYLPSMSKRMKLVVWPIPANR